MVTQHLDWADFAALVATPRGREDLGDPSGALVVVADVPPHVDPAVTAAAHQLTAVVATLGDDVGLVSDVVDVLVDDAGLRRLEGVAGASPQAATALALLLRGSRTRPLLAGLHVESAVYAALQAGPEFAAWRAGALPVPRAAGAEPVRVERIGDVLSVTLNRPDVHNALDAATRDALASALHVALADAALAVQWRGAGATFCSGGDLNEFGTRPDPATAHLVRMTRSLPALVAALAGRMTVFVHGRCAGSGVELPAFAERVVAAPEATFRLPELGFGLVPGAGGTASIPRRIGRHRTAWLAMTGAEIDAGQALAWGLVDEVAGA